jgi:hypothetical protein
MAPAVVAADLCIVMPGARQASVLNEKPGIRRAWPFGYASRYAEIRCVATNYRGHRLASPGICFEVLHGLKAGVPLAR